MIHLNKLFARRSMLHLDIPLFSFLSTSWCSFSFNQPITPSSSYSSTDFSPLPPPLSLSRLLLISHLSIFINRPCSLLVDNLFGFPHHFISS
eukprot:m.180557 g.180557  ORF g.180557 m.180557 type:complete len:92 (-) comp16616_c0_seq3:2761-3036(-)